MADNQVIEQLNYYFSDINLRKDEFMKRIMRERNGWISLDILMRFQKLSRMVGHDKSRLRRIVGNWYSDLIEVDINKDRVRRRPDKPIHPTVDTSLDIKTLFFEGFPYGTKQEDVLQWAQEFGATNRVTLTGTSAYVTFTDQSVADKLLGQPVVEFRGSVIAKEKSCWALNSPRSWITERHREIMDCNQLNLILIDMFSPK